MNHSLIPDIILSNVAQRRSRGHFHAVCLFVDIAGFTALTSALMEHGIEGTEVIAEVLNAVFEPLIEVVYAYGGFIATFAGDAFTAIFPTEADQAYLRATLAAAQINQLIAHNPTQKTRFGPFNFAIKVSLADGMVSWGVWRTGATRTDQRAAAGDQQRAAYFFRGEALTLCQEADRLNAPGAVIMTTSVANRLPSAVVTVEPYAQYRRLTHISVELKRSDAQIASAIDPSTQPWIADFFPLDLFERQGIGEFRQVATVFINLQRWPTGLKAKQFQQTLFRLLAQFGGYLSFVGHIGNQDQGCSLLLFWGAPTSAENNLRRALHFATELRKAAAIPLRASVVFNLVYAGFVGSTLHKAYTCYGAYVNLAARQLVNANWGEICLDEHTARQVQVEFSVREQGWYSLKGFAAKQLVFLLEQRHEATDPAFRRTLMVGRQREWEQLWEAVQPLLHGRFGGVVTLVGEAGMGKSRLVYEFQVQMHLYRAFEQPDTAQAQAFSPADVVWCTCRTDELLHQPLHPFVYWLRHFFQQSTSKDDLGNKQCFAEQWDALIAATADPALVAELGRTRSLLAALLGLYWEDSLYHHLEPQLRLANTLDALKTLIQAESLRHPLIFYIEDSHWLDAQSQLLLAKLMRQMTDFPVIFLVTTRPAASGEQNQAAIQLEWTQPNLQQTTVHLLPLTKRDVYLLATYQLKGMVTASLADWLYQYSWGNPFFAEQILHYWQERELLVWSDQGWQLYINKQALPADSISPLSANLRTMFTAQLDRLPRAVKEVVQTAAVLGIEFDRDVLDCMLRHHPALSIWLAVAEQANIWTALEPARYLFRHVLLRDEAYDMQLRSALRSLHQQAAEAIAQVYAPKLAHHYADLVYHFQQSGDRRQECRYAQLAGDHAANQYANADAVAYFSRALALLDQQALAERYRLLIKREAIYHLLGQRQEQAQDLHDLATLATAMADRHAQMEVQLKRATYERMTGHYEAALDLLEQVVGQATELNDRVTSAQAYHAWGRILVQQGFAQAALPKLQNALTIARAVTSYVVEADSLYDIGHVYHAGGQEARAAEYYTQACRLYEILGNQRGVIHCLLMFGVIANEQGDYMAAQQNYSEAITRARAIGWRYMEAASLTNLGNNYFDFGDYKTALSCHQHALVLCREIDDREGEAVSLDTLGLIWQNLGNNNSACTHFEQALQIQQQIGDRHGEGFTRTHLGYALYALGDLKAAAVAFQTACDLRDELGEVSYTMDDLAGLAQIALTQGEIRRAISFVEKIEAWLRTEGTDGIEFPILVYWISYQVLEAAAQLNPTLMNHALTLLRNGHTLLQQRAGKIQDRDLRREFLENVWFNREFLACWDSVARMIHQTYV